MALISACHSFGWPVAQGGSRSITDALAAVLARARRQDRDRRPGQRRWPSCPTAERGRASTSRPARSPTSPATACRAGSRAPTAATGTAPAPSRSTSPSRAASPGPTRPAGGPARSTSAGPSRRSSPPSARSTAAGCRSARSSSSASSTSPTPRRSAGDVHPIWAYAHVPSGYDGDATEAIHRPDRALRAGPARADRRHGRPLARRVRRPTTPTTSAATSSPAPTPRSRSLIRPRFALDPYATGIPGVFICSAATPPGAGVHGMNGYNAARSALRGLEA